ncbi:MAG: gluconate 2-dehydrogenase subunit 3 family protein [Pseudonocardiales bacterium]|nr:gluconate 2-dehydrogenase subunit 3 family protein [Pseudonocardiales bacterium]MBV9447326.1 gluconate 2-dehydrogenase subunit 3 family protein [Streptosporangiaceae bacterium]MBV9729994.1 gluconate 2-dehydrogenase subunit 3 family protein [Pseudonocardiales bacterium]
MPDLTSADHLPKRRPGGAALHPSWLPRQRRGTTPQMIGRYPDFNVLDAVDTWDEATKKVVLARLEPPGPLRFFTSDEEPVLRALCDTVLAQDREPRVPVAEMVDGKLADGLLDGYQYADMPDDRDTWRLVLRGLDHTATLGYQTGFAGCAEAQREAIVSEFAQGRLVGGAWDELNVAHAWSVVIRMMLAAFYSHPWAWNEIGFGGPAYPRGFMRLGGPGADGPAVREPFEQPGATDEDPVQVVDAWER